MELTVDFPEAHNQRAGPPSRQTQPRGVSFAEAVRVDFVDDLALEHKTELFYSQHELASFKHRVGRQIRLLEEMKANCNSMSEYAGMLVEFEDTGAFLGLERLLTDSTCREIRQRQRAHVMTVFLEQWRQTSLGIQDAEMMATFSKAGSGASQRRARIVGLLHATNVQF